MNNTELQQLRELPIEGVAERLGLEVSHHKCLCPFHDDHHASLSFCVRRNTYRCFVCDAHGGTIDLVMHILHMDFLDACRWLGADQPSPSPLHSPLSPNRSASPAPAHSEIRIQNSEFQPARYARFFLRPWLSEEARHFLFEERRLDPRVVHWCRLTSWRDRRGTPWLQIPYYDRQGQLVGVQNRNLVRGAQPRFRFPSGSKCGIYNLPILSRLTPGEELYIAEGASDCWALLSVGHKAIAIPSATLLSRQDVEILSALTANLSTNFHMYPDADMPGERLFLQLRQVLPNLEHHQLPKGCKDFSDYYLQMTRD